MRWVQPRISCACIEVDGIGYTSLEQFTFEFSLQYSRVGKHYRTVLFSDAVRNEAGRQLAKILKPHGKLTVSPEAPNPIHDNKPIEVFIWQPSDKFMEDTMPDIAKAYLKKIKAAGYDITKHPYVPVMHQPGA